MYGKKLIAHQEEKILNERKENTSVQHDGEKAVKEKVPVEEGTKEMTDIKTQVFSNVMQELQKESLSPAKGQYYVHLEKTGSMLRTLLEKESGYTEGLLFN